jgi:hypothetical protein
MKIVIAAGHEGYLLRREIIGRLVDGGQEVADKIRRFERCRGKTD